MLADKYQSSFFACSNDFILFENNKIKKHWGKSINLSEVENKEIVAIISDNSSLYYLYYGNKNEILFGCRTDLEKIELGSLQISNQIFVNEKSFINLSPTIIKAYPGISYMNLLKYIVAFEKKYIDEKFIKENEQFKYLYIDDYMFGLHQNGNLMVVGAQGEVNNKISENVENLISVTTNATQDFCLVMYQAENNIKVCNIFDNTSVCLDENSHNVKKGIISTDGMLIVLLFDDSKAKLYELRSENDKLYYKNIVCDLLEDLSGKIKDIAIRADNMVGLLLDNSEIRELSLNGVDKQ